MGTGDVGVREAGTGNGQPVVASSEEAVKLSRGVHDDGVECWQGMGL